MLGNGPGLQKWRVDWQLQQIRIFFKFTDLLSSWRSRTWIPTTPVVPRASTGVVSRLSFYFTPPPPVVVLSSNTSVSGFTPLVLVVSLTSFLPSHFSTFLNFIHHLFEIYPPKFQIFLKFPRSAPLSSQFPKILPFLPLTPPPPPFVCPLSFFYLFFFPPLPLSVSCQAAAPTAPWHFVSCSVLALKPPRGFAGTTQATRHLTQMDYPCFCQTKITQERVSIVGGGFMCSTLITSSTVLFNILRSPTVQHWSLTFS